MEELLDVRNSIQVGRCVAGDGERIEANPDNDETLKPGVPPRARSLSSERRVRVRKSFHSPARVLLVVNFELDELPCGLHYAAAVGEGTWNNRDFRRPS